MGVTFINKFINVRTIKISNVILFQAGWFISVLTNSFVSVVYSTVFIAIHLLLIKISSHEFNLKKEIHWLLVFLCFGLICETLFFSFGILYSVNTSNPSIPYLIFPPSWLLCLWVMFATSMRTSLAFMLKKHWFPLLVVTILAPFSYFSGAYLNGEIKLHQPLAISFIAISLAWVCVFWITISIKQKYFKEFFRDY